MSEAIQDAISALEDERAVMDQKIAAVREAVLEQIDAAIETLRGLGGGAPRKGAAKARKTWPKRPAKSQAPPQQAQRASPTGGRIEVALARDQAIKVALKGGAKPSSALLAVLPKEPGQTPEQREAALRNALSRLRMRKVIASKEDGWTLV